MLTVDRWRRSQVGPMGGSALRGLLGVIAVTVPLALLGCSSSPTESARTVILEGQLGFQGSDTHSVPVLHSGVTTIAVDDLRKVLWDVTLGDFASVPSVTVAVGSELTGECVVTGRLVIPEGQFYLWSVKEGPLCFVVSDSGIIPVNGLLAYTVRLELPG